MGLCTQASSSATSHVPVAPQGRYAIDCLSRAPHRICASARDCPRATALMSQQNDLAFSCVVPSAARATSAATAELNETAQTR